MTLKKFFCINLLTLLVHIVSIAQENNTIIDEVIAIVGNNVILKSDVDMHYAQIMAQQGDVSGDLKCMIFEQLLLEKLLLNQAELDSVAVTEKQVDSELDRRMRYFINQIGSEEKLEQLYNKSMVEIKADLREKVREQLLSETMKEKITGDVKITPSEVNTFFKSIPSDSLPYINTEVEIAQIVKYPKISDKEKEEVKAKLTNIRERILKGDNFSTLAILYSEDPGSAKKGGELGFVQRSDLVPEFAAVAFNLKEGEVSRIVETDFGYHIIQLIEKKGELINIRHILMTPKVSPYEMLKTKQYMDSISKLINKIDTLTFQKAAELFSDDENTKYNQGIMINPSTGNSRFELDDLDAGTYMAIKNMKVGQISAPFESVDNKGKRVYKIILLKNYIKPHKANLNDDYQIIQELALEEKKKNIIEKWIQAKQKNSYIHIKPSYINCAFQYPGWIK